MFTWLPKLIGQTRGIGTSFEGIPGSEAAFPATLVEKLFPPSQLLPIALARLLIVVETKKILQGARIIDAHSWQNGYRDSEAMRISSGGVK